MNQTTAATTGQNAVHPIVNQVGGVFMHVSNMERSVNWYHRLFNLPERSSVTDKVHSLKMDGKTGFVLDQHGMDRGLAIQDRPLLMLDSPDVHAAYRYVKQLGIPIEWEIEEYPGMAFFTFRDPDRNLLMVCGKPGQKEVPENSPATNAASNQTIRYDGGGTWLVVSDSAYHGVVTNEGLELTGRSVTDASYATPLRMSTSVWSEKGCLRLKYGPHGELTFNFGSSADGGAGGEFYVHHPKIKKEFDYLQKGAIPTGEWVHIEWTILDRSMEVRVNGALFHTQEGYFGDTVAKAGIGCDNGRVIVKSFAVEAVSGQETSPNLPIHRAGGEMDILVPDPTCYPILTQDGLWLTSSHPGSSARTNQIYAAPFTMEAVIRSDTQSVVLYGGASAQAKLHRNGALSFLDPVTREEIWVEGKGQLSGEFTRVTWRMEESRTSVLVDGELRFEREGNYAGCRFALGVGADLGGAVIVKSVSVISA